MKTSIFAAVLLSLSTLAMADAKLAETKNCMSCHSYEKKLLGPSYKAIAEKYGSKDASVLKENVAKLSVKVLNGGGGVWPGSVVAMPANKQVNEAEAKKLVEWILAGAAQ